jgi:hypothetical protein
MFTRTSSRMGVRFASGNVYYMNRTFTARHLQSVAGPLSTGFIAPMRFASHAFTASPSGILPVGGNTLSVASLLAEPVGCGRAARLEIMQVLCGLDMVPTSVLKDCFVCASEDAQTASDATAPQAP